MLTKIDELILPDHARLEPKDECYFIGEYTKGGGYQYSSTNQFVYNLKKSVTRRGLPDYHYKTDAIHRAARELRQSLNPEFIALATFVPIPPSKTVDDPLYDDRMTQVLGQLDATADVRELVQQLVSVPEAHFSASRPGPQEIYENYVIDVNLIEPTPAVIAVVDDVLTAGAHFKAMKRLLMETFQDAHIVGLFLARRVPNTEIDG
jgi:hypothetical protein